MERHPGRPTGLLFAAGQRCVWTTGLLLQEMRTGATGPIRVVCARDPDLDPIEIPEQA